MSLTKRVKSATLHIGLAASLFAGFKGLDLIATGVAAEYAIRKVEETHPALRFLGNTFMYFTSPEEKAALGVYKHWTNEDTFDALGLGSVLLIYGAYGTLGFHQALYKRRRL